MDSAELLLRWARCCADERGAEEIVVVKNSSRTATLAGESDAKERFSASFKAPGKATEYAVNPYDNRTDIDMGGVVEVNDTLDGLLDPEMATIGGST